MKVRKSNELILSFFVNTDTSSDKKAGDKYRFIYRDKGFHGIYQPCDFVARLVP